jgi:KaiC/GvpD/RAD55 family RecA-like ATPase
MTIDGPAGSGKTYTALRFAHALGGRIALIDTERGSASKYVGDAPDGIPWDFDVLNLTVFSPEKYTEAILTAGRAGYSVLVIDSLSHAWEGVGGALEIKQRVGESWSAWRHVTPIHNRMVDAILQSPCHVITTMRSRMEYVQEVDQTTGRIIVRKVGMAPIQRPGTEYEFDLVCDLDWAHIMTVSKSRCPAVADKIVERPGPEFMQPIIEWLSSGVNVPNASMTPNEMQFVETITLDMLLAQYGAEAILAANGGAIPGTQEEINLIAELLRLSQES